MFDMKKTSFNDTIVNNMERNVVLYHHTDGDGYGAYVLAELIKKFYKNVKIQSIACPVHADRILEDIDNLYNLDEIDDIFIVDLSISNEVIANKLAVVSDRINLVMLDHHASALWLNDYIYANVKVHDIDNGILHCGTELFYEYIKPIIDSLPGNPRILISDYVNMVTSYDTWNWDKINDENAYDLNLIFKSKNPIRFANDILANILINDQIFSLSDIIIIDTMKSVIQTYKSKCKKYLEFRKLDKYTVGICYCTEYISEVGNYLCKEFPNMDFVIMVNPIYNSASLRTIKDIDLYKIAKKYSNGGGHNKSAGCPILFDFKDVLNKLVKDIEFKIIKEE